uniref:Bm13224 n=1 Tax=Brugia malayi TaxID=6279 RepID=A0A1I9G669_BRUMA|nr:Bm13224 [Brugia malayi]
MMVDALIVISFLPLTTVTIATFNDDLISLRWIIREMGNEVMERFGVKYSVQV